MTEQTEQTTAKPGAILRAARDEKGLSLAQVADSLHLRSSVVEAMEACRYEEFDSAVFLKGYYRSYCRLVGLHEERMIELLDSQLSALEADRAEEESLVEKAKQAAERRKYMKIAVALAVLALLVVFGLSFISNEEPDSLVLERAPSSASDAIQTLPESTPAEMADKASETEGALLVEVEEAATEESSAVPSEALSARENDEMVAPVETLVVVEAEDSRQVRTEEGAQATSENVADPVVEPTQASIQTPSEGFGRIALSFSGDCWFSLKNGTGRTPIAELRRAGSESSYEGELPFRVVLGDARVAELSFNGKPVDLSPYITRNGRAEFTLE